MGIHWIALPVMSIITFCLLLILVRWIGETQISQATYFNWVAGACMGNISANMITATGVADVVNSAAELTLFSAVTIVASTLSLKSRKFRRIASGEPILLIHHGSYIYNHLKRSKIDVDLMQQMLREQGYFDYQKVECAILEPTGSLSIMPMEQNNNIGDGESASSSDTQKRNPNNVKREESNHTK